MSMLGTCELLAGSANTDTICSGGCNSALLNLSASCNASLPDEASFKSDADEILAFYCSDSPCAAAYNLAVDGSICDPSTWSGCEGECYEARVNVSSFCDPSNAVEATWKRNAEVNLAACHPRSCEDFDLFLDGALAAVALSFRRTAPPGCRRGR